MRECLEVTGKTVEAAVNQALATWNVTRDEVEIIVVEEPSKGFLGFGARDAKVKVFRKDTAAAAPTPAVKSVEEVAPGVAVFNDVRPTEPATPAAAPETIRLTETEPLTLERASEPEPPAQVVAASSEEEKENTSNRRGRERDVFFSEEEQDAAAQRGKEFLQQVTQSMGVTVMIEKMTAPDMIRLHLHGDDLGLLIGKRGTTLDALQYLTNLAANRDVRGRYFIMLDVENYRARREETLVALARRMATKVKKNRRKVVLEPMNAYERKIIHTALQDDPQVYTLSEGEYQDRHLVIHYRE